MTYQSKLPLLIKVDRFKQDIKFLDQDIWNGYSEFDKGRYIGNLNREFPGTFDIFIKAHEILCPTTDVYEILLTYNEMIEICDIMIKLVINSAFI